MSELRAPYVVQTLRLADVSSGFLALTHGLRDTCLHIRAKEGLKLSDPPPPPPEPIFQDHPEHYMDETDPDFSDAVYVRLIDNITKYVSDPQVVRG